MIRASHPDPNRLAYRIKTALTGESNGQDTAKLAWQYAAAVERVNQALAITNELLEQDSIIPALCSEHFYPNLLEATHALAIDQFKTWKERCETFAWRVPQPVDIPYAIKLENAISNQKELKDELTKAYKTAKKSKKRPEAFQLSALLATHFPEDEAHKEMAQQERAHMLESFDLAVKSALEELLPSQTPANVIDRFRDQGLTTKESKSPLVAEVLQQAEQELIEALHAEIDTVTAACVDLEKTANWQETERLYLTCDYKLSLDELRSKISPEKRADLEAAGNALSRLRSSHETIITIRQAIAELKASLSASKTPGRKPKRLLVADRLEKLRSLEKQAVLTMGQMPEGLQSEIQDAYKFARRKRFPLPLIASGVAALFACAALIAWNASQKQAEQRRQNEAAISALQEAETSPDTTSVQKTIEEWLPQIEEASPDSPLVQQSELLNEWLVTQHALEDEYAKAAETLSNLAQAEDPYAYQEEIEALIQKTDKLREDLASDLGTDTENRISLAVANWKDRIQESERQYASELGKLERSITLATQNAAQANTKESFDRLHQTANERLNELNQLASQSQDPQTTGKIITFIEKSRATLTQSAQQWERIQQSRDQLAQASDTKTYFDSLQSLVTLNVLSQEERSSITSVLAQEDAFLSLKRKLLFQDSQEAWDAFAGTPDYVAETIKPNEAETAQLQSLLDDSVFATVYETTVEYFEGSADPQSSFQMFLSQPVSKGESVTGAETMAFGFRVLGFNEEGQAEENPDDKHLISLPDGSFWGFFYKPSALSDESEYYNTVIKGTIKSVIAGAPRFSLYRLCAELDGKSSLSPAFRIYWQQSLLTFMEENPWKWGIALSPTAQNQLKRLKALPAGTLSNRLWLSSIEQSSASPEFGNIFLPTETVKAVQEIRALATLYELAMKGDFAFAGRIDQLGKPQIEQPPSSEQDPLWALDAQSSAIAPLAKVDTPMPFSPIVTFRFEKGGAASLLELAQASSSLDLSKAQLKALWPQLLQ